MTTESFPLLPPAGLTLGVSIPSALPASPMICFGRSCATRTLLAISCRCRQSCFFDIPPRVETHKWEQSLNFLKKLNRRQTRSWDEEPSSNSNPYYHIAGCPPSLLPPSNERERTYLAQSPTQTSYETDEVPVLQRESAWVC